VYDSIERPGIVFGHGRRLAEATHIRADDSVIAREVWDPCEPCGTTFSEAVKHEHGFRILPWVGVVVDLIEHFQIWCDAKDRHATLLVSVGTAEERSASTAGASSSCEGFCNAGRLLSTPAVDI